jgi:hypothetical protein
MQNILASCAREMIDLERRLSKFSIPLIGGAHFGAKSLVVISIFNMILLYRSPIHWGGRDLLLAQIFIPAFAAARVGGGEKQDP